MAEKKIDIKAIIAKVKEFFSDFKGNSKALLKKCLAKIETAAEFILAVVLVCWDKLKAFYIKIRDKFRSLKKEKPEQEGKPKKKIFKFFQNIAEKDYAKFWAYFGMGCFAVFAIVIVVVSLIKPSPASPARIEPVEDAPVSMNTASITFGGSVMIQNSLLESCKTEIGDYEIYDSLQYLTPCFTSDLNLVSVIGAVNETSAPVSALPKTNYPINLARALKSIHVNGVALASDHSFDAGVAGIDSTIAAFDEQSILPFGLFKDATDYNEPRIFDLNGIKIGIINATGVVDDDYNALAEADRINRVKHFNVNNIDYSTKMLLGEVKTLKDSGVDFVIALLRWGSESLTEPPAPSRELADNLVKNGVDIILGYGSNYMQKVTFKEFTQTDGTKKNCLIMYDLGNIYSDNSSAADTYAIPQDSTLITVELSLNTDGSTSIKKAEYTPIYVSQRRDNDISNRSEFVTIPSETYSAFDELPDIFSTDEQWRWCKKSFERVQNKMKKWVEQRITLTETPAM